MSIKSIKTTASDLNTNRISQIRNFVKDISANKSIQAKRVSSYSGDGKIIFCVTDNPKITDSTQFANNRDLNERFKTKNPLYKASYYEIWDKVINSKEDYCLNRIYFHLYLSEEDKEYVLLHADPLDNDLVHGIYKRSPHLHIKDAKNDNLAHAHFALNINDYDIALSSIEEVNKCFKNHIDMLSHQILEIR